MSSPPLRGKSIHNGRSALLWLFIWLTLYFAIRFWLESNPAFSAQLRLSVAFIPTPFFALFLWTFIRNLRGSDELERRIQLEALAVAFPVGLLFLTTLGLVQRAVILDFQNWSFNHVWPFFALFYLVGLWIARRRYA